MRIHRISTSTPNSSRPRMKSCTSWWTSACQGKTKIWLSKQLWTRFCRRQRMCLVRLWRLNELRVHLPIAENKTATSIVRGRSIQSWMTPWNMQIIWAELKSIPYWPHRSVPSIATHLRIAWAILSWDPLAPWSRPTSWTHKKSWLQANSATNGRTFTEISHRLTQRIQGS